MLTAHTLTGVRIEASTIEEMLGSVTPERRADLEIVDPVIRDAAPELERQLYAGPSITMIGYGSMGWQRNSGQGVWPLIGMASQKQYISADELLAGFGER